MHSASISSTSDLSPEAGVPPEDPSEDDPSCDVPPDDDPPPDDPPENPPDDPPENDPPEDDPAEDSPPEDCPTEDDPPSDDPPENDPPEDDPAEDSPPEDYPAEDDPPENEPPEEYPPEDDPLQEDTPEDGPPEDYPPEENPLDENPPEDDPPQEDPPEDDPLEDYLPEERPPEGNPPETPQKMTNHRKIPERRSGTKTRLEGINVVIMAFLLGDGKPAEWSQAEQWQKMDPDQRAAVRKISALGAEEAPTTNNIDAKKLAKKMAKWVKDNDVDGIDVDYEDMKAMAAGKSEQWIIDFTKQLYSELDRTHIINHAPIAGWFTPPRDELPGGGYRKVHKEFGHMVDWYNIQFYNSPGEDTTCHNMLEKSGSYLSESSVFELHDRSQVPLEKIVIGKPASKKDAATGYMDAKQLGTCLEQASAKNWNTGFMLWQELQFPGKILAVGIWTPLSSTRQFSIESFENRLQRVPNKFRLTRALRSCIPAPYAVRFDAPELQNVSLTMLSLPCKVIRRCWRLGYSSSRLRHDLPQAATVVEWERKVLRRVILAARAPQRSLGGASEWGAVGLRFRVATMWSYIFPVSYLQIELKRVYAKWHGHTEAGVP
ncbi:glycoside hydrolase superfamily [Mycena rebaudengoi]|nr:glycoside hydrolase superfamily [Mycena rebaudengoi]